ncbi:hypothetical protein XhhCFBP4925_01640 [Xanthomonas hortorum pv. hederae]|nr:hypothetical protein XhhCFBP4925_01640 [Xanthomonas hortorum pv. hederae]PUF00096.1 hypothetical protein C7T87_10075 [Xanthomonas hortorum pv. hederae]
MAPALLAFDRSTAKRGGTDSTVPAIEKLWNGHRNLMRCCQAGAASVRDEHLPLVACASCAPPHLSDSYPPGSSGCS